MKKYLLLGVMVCLLFNVNGQQPQPKKTASVEGITEYEYPNGLRVLLFPDQTKSTATVNMTYLVGSRMEGYGETGMAHLLEHMVFPRNYRLMVQVQMVLHGMTEQIILKHLQQLMKTSIGHCH